MSVTDDRSTGPGAAAGAAGRRGVRTNGVDGPGRAAIGAGTLRTDRWWLAPLTTFVVFSAFVVYATWRAFSGSDFHSGAYLSPFYSPCLTDECGAEGVADLGTPLGGFPFSPALVILIFPLGFRMTCYYYRKAYYRAFWFSPPACAVAEPHTRYTGETRLPLIVNNLHRYFWYAAIAVGLVLTYDLVLAFRDIDGGRVGLGNLIFAANVAFIWLYTLSCHSCRHAMGGRLRHFSKHPVRYRLWTWVSAINVHHAKFAWYSLFSVAIADLYVYLLATGTISETRIF